MRSLSLLLGVSLLLLTACDDIGVGKPVETAVPPDVSTSLFAAGYRGGVYQSTNGGKTWTPLLPEAADLAHYFKVLASGPGPTLYLGTTGQGLYRVELEDAQGPMALPALKGANVKAILADQTDPDRLYVATWGEGVMLSRDRGATWSPWNDGLTYRYVRTLAIAPTTPPTLYAGTVGGVFARQMDRPAWESRSRGLGVLHVKALAIDPDEPQVLYAGTAPDRHLVSLYRSRDGGVSWTALRAGPRGVTVFTIVPTPGTAHKVLVGTSRGVEASRDGGEHWEDWGAGLPGAPVYSLVLSRQAPGAVFAATHGGVYRRLEADDRWRPLRYGLEGEMVTGLLLAQE